MPQHSLDVHKHAKCALRWSGITKTVKIAQDKSGLIQSSIGMNANEINNPNKEFTDPMKTILNNVSGSALPGEVLALMGPSGSGKTSLLDTLSGRSLYEEGVLSVNGIIIDESTMKKFKRKIAYVKQADIFFGHLTVRDQLTYTALLRLPSHFQKTEKHEEVTRIINLLHLQKCADTPIRLLSGGEKKRVNIGTELLTDPQVVILDEPTSGLDSTSAVALIRVLQDLARHEGKTIITSIHQPSSAVFLAFDKLMMLAEGNVAYFGTPTLGMKYLSEKGIECPQGYNAADHWMDLLVKEIPSENKNDDTTVDSRSADSSKDKTGPISLDDLDMDDVTGTERIYPMENEKHSDVLACDKGTNKIHIEKNVEIGDGVSGMSNTCRFLISAWDSNIQASDTQQSIESDKEFYSDEQTFSGKSINRYNTSWKTQFFVLVHRAMRNSRAAIFTPLNMIKAGGVGLMMGLLFFQLPNTEKRIEDRLGWLFFSLTFCIFDSMFPSVMSFPLERAILFKERASGSYHLSAYFLAKSISEIPTRMAIPSVYMTISYWLAGINNNFFVFLGTMLCFLLAGMAGESLGLAVGAAFMNFRNGFTFLVVFSQVLFVLGGFYVRNIPIFVSMVGYLSPWKYGFSAAVQLVFNQNVPCDGSGVIEFCRDDGIDFISPSEIQEMFGDTANVELNVCALIVFIVLLRYIAYLCLLSKKGKERIH